MSFRLLYGGDTWLHCDAESCPSELLAVGAAATLDNAYQGARDQGWVQRNGKDYCPEHGR